MINHRWFSLLLLAALGVPHAVCAQAVTSEDGSSTGSRSTEVVNIELAKIRHLIEEQLVVPQPELYRRHLQSVLVLCEDAALTAKVAGPAYKDEDEMLGYLKVIESGLGQPDVKTPASYLVDGMRDLVIAQISHLDGTIQMYTVRLPANWDPNKAYPLWVQIHGRWSDLALAAVANKLGPPDEYEKRDDDAIILTPWVRGNTDYRLKFGSEPDVWEAIDDLKTFAKLDPNRWYISGHSWGGNDTWSIVLRTPDLWAAAGVMAGNPRGLPEQLGLVGNARHVPFYLWRGSMDQTPNRSEWALEYFRDALTAVGDPPKVIVAAGVPHMYRPQDIAAMGTWLFLHSRHRPNSFSFVIDTREHRGVWGISVPVKYEGAYFDVGPKVSFRCVIDGSTVRIDTKNSTRIDVDLGPQGLGMLGQVKLIVNGRQMFDGPAPTKPLVLTW